MAARRKHFVIVWEFRVRRGREREFAQRYGPQGDWARLFRRGSRRGRPRQGRGRSGYVRSDLLRDREMTGRYFTVDVWTSPGAYAAFRQRWRTEYAAIDAQCERLTTRERLIGHFTM